jgi:shikimate kinase
MAGPSFAKRLLESVAMVIFQEEILFRKVIAENRGAVISTGGGLVESSTAREALRSAFSSFVVVQIHRNIQDIEEYLNKDTTRVIRNFLEISY